LRRSLQNALSVFRAGADMLMLAIAWQFAYYLRFSGWFEAPLGIPELAFHIKLLPFIWGIWFLVFATSGFYTRSGKHRTAFLEALDVIQSCILATLGFFAFSYVYVEYRYSRATMLLFAVLHPCFIIFARSVIRKTLRRYRKKAPPRKTLVIGSGSSLRHAVEMSRMGDLIRGDILGVILHGNARQMAEGTVFCKQNQVDVIEAPSDWVQFLEQTQAETVIFALPHNSYDFLDKNLEAIANQVPDIRLLPDLMKYTQFAAGIDVINGTPIITIHESPLRGLGHVVKRVIDIFGALSALVLFSPVLIGCALLIPLMSRGPVFYRQERMGLDGRKFTILKFRSMPIGSEKETGAIFAKEGDDRPTGLGRFLRKSSLDELPQFFNVLRGEMSLVGPRPERPVFVEQFRRKVPGYYLRHKVKAGCTGWAQVNGWRGNTSIEKRIECDLFYIQNWSVWLDFRIIFLTILRGFVNRNAY
jgi:Undecaprenyl-phosphate glucose phosphotransferase